MLAVFNMLRQDAQGVFSLAWADFHDSVDYGLTERHIRVVLEAVAEELKKYWRLLRNTDVELTHRLNGLNFEFNAEVWQVGADLLEELLHLILVACL